MSDKQFTEEDMQRMSETPEGKRIGAIVDGIFEALKPTLDGFKERLAQLEARNDFVDRGTWKEGLVASKNHGCTHEGSFWIAQRATMSKPGTSDDWRLAVKRGRDGKDARR